MDDKSPVLDVQEAKAVFAFGYLILYVKGDKSTPCHNIDIERSLLTVEPPTFIVTQTLPAGTICTQVVTPFEFSKSFFIGVFRDSIKIVDSQETKEILVKQFK
ncbi:hypothetical protein [Mastigocoleus testarum]|nr:hypothetical protein [Mastigocoleus testarum]